MKKFLMILLLIVISISFAEKNLPNPGDFELLTIEDKPEVWQKTKDFTSL